MLAWASIHSLLAQNGINSILAQASIILAFIVYSSRLAFILFNVQTESQCPVTAQNSVTNKDTQANPSLRCLQKTRGTFLFSQCTCSLVQSKRHKQSCVAFNGMLLNGFIVNGSAASMRLEVPYIKNNHLLNSIRCPSISEIEEIFRSSPKIQDSWGLNEYDENVK